MLRHDESAITCEEQLPKMSTRNHYGHVGAKDHAWEKASTIRGMDEDKYRKDSVGNVIYYNSYGMTSTMGWELDHIKARANGGSDHPKNIQALQASANRSKGKR